MGHLGANFGPIWASLGQLGSNLVPTWTIVVHIGASFGTTSYKFGLTLRQIESTCAQLATTWNQRWRESANQTPRQSQSDLQKSFKKQSFFNIFGFQAIQSTTYAHHPHFRNRKCPKSNPKPPSSTQNGAPSRPLWKGTGSLSPPILQSSNPPILQSSNPLSLRGGLAHLLTPPPPGSVN